MTRFALRLSALVVALVACGGRSQAGLISNGGFEAGLGDWGGGRILLADHKYDPFDPAPAAVAYQIQQSSGITPISGVSGIPGPAAGMNYALSDMNAVSSVLLGKSFVVPTNAVSVTLRYDMFVYNLAGDGGAIDPAAGLDPSSPTVANQHARVDLLSGFGPPGGVNVFTTDPSLIVRNFYQGVDPEGQNGNTDGPRWRHYSFDLTPWVTPGEQYFLRFAVVNNEFPIYMGVDNVDIVVPEPATWLLAAIGLAPFGVSRSARRRPTPRCP